MSHAAVFALAANDLVALEKARLLSSESRLQSWMATKDARPPANHVNGTRELLGNALELFASLQEPLLSLRCCVGVAELELLAGHVSRAQAYWLEAWGLVQALLVRPDGSPCVRYGGTTGFHSRLSLYAMRLVRVQCRMNEPAFLAAHPEAAIVRRVFLMCF